MRVGEKETSEQAAIVARYANLFSRAQIEALARRGSRMHPATSASASTACARPASPGSSPRSSPSVRMRSRTRCSPHGCTWQGEELPLRAAQAKLAVLPDYREREELGELQALRSADFNDDRLELITAGEELEAELSGEPDPVARNEEEKQISLRDLERALAAASRSVDDAWERMRAEWFERLLGPERGDVPSSAHVAWIRRLSPLESTYTKERSVEVCMDTLTRLGFDLENDPNVRLDLEDRPQKSPRACVIASDPPKVVHLITRAQGGLHDYQAFMHEAGHALHYAGVDPGLPYTFRKISRDHALTEIYSYILEAITREPGWHDRYFSAPENAQAPVFLEALLFRRYTAKLQFELAFWSDFPNGAGGDEYSKRLTDATGIRYRPDAFLSDMDAGFYSADYLRAWIRSAQLRTYLEREIGEDWWQNPKTGDHLRGLWHEGTKPSSEEIAARIGFEPFDTGPLVAELGG